MLTVSCVLRSGGAYDATWVEKLQRGVARHLSVPHRFVCFSDVPVPCERLPLLHDWPGWWAKVSIFDGLVEGPQLYLDLDTIITGPLDALASLPHKFAMLRGSRRHYIGSGVMWINQPMRWVYERFCTDPEGFMRQYAANPTNAHNAFNAHRGDQAYIFDAVGNTNIARLTDDVPGMIRLYPRHFTDRLPEGCAVVIFKGKVKPPMAMGHAWAQEAWA